MNIGANLKRIRKEKGLTQKQLGELCIPPIAESTIRRYELGKLNPKLETVKRIADALQVDFTQILEIDNEENFEKTSKDLGDLIKLAESDTFYFLKAMLLLDSTVKKMGFTNVNEVSENFADSPSIQFALDPKLSSLTDDELREIANFIDFVKNKKNLDE